MTDGFLAFDNVAGRAWFREDQSWSRADIVLDVLSDSKVISFGVLLKGQGIVWIDTASLESVLRHIATTGTPVTGPRLPVAPDQLPPSPVNLGFEAMAEQTGLPQLCAECPAAGLVRGAPTSRSEVQ